jgi:dGTPase
MLPKSLYSEGDYQRLYPLHVNNNFDEHYERQFSFDLSNLTHTPAFRRLTAKTQLLPELENEFFRNRLTHSLEVADVAVKIAKKINREHSYFSENNGINLNLIRFAGLAHDLGHPPFGHKGEKALDKLMRNYCKKYRQYKYDKNIDEEELNKEYGMRFEGNAQNIRILTALEKKYTEEDPEISGLIRCLGINPTFRSIASILKYDTLLNDDDYEVKYNEIRIAPQNNINKKGYYLEEAELIKEVKRNITGVENYNGKFRTLECNIMEFADDISYTVYDLEDVLKGRFISFLDITERLLISKNQGKLQNLFNTVISDLEKAKKSNSIFETDSKISTQSPLELYTTVIQYFLTVYLGDEGIAEYSKNKTKAFELSRHLAKDGFFRMDLIEVLVNHFVGNIKVENIHDIPALTDVKMEQNAFLLMSFLKHFIYLTITSTARIQIVDYRGEEIVTEIFNTLYLHANLLPDDMKELFDAHQDYCNKDNVLNTRQLRCICDYVACMSNRYAIEFYARLKSENHHSIFKPF